MDDFRAEPVNAGTERIPFIGYHNAGRDQAPSSIEQEDLVWNDPPKKLSKLDKKLKLEQSMLFPAKSYKFLKNIELEEGKKDKKTYCNNKSLCGSKAEGTLPHFNQDSSEITRVRRAVEKDEQQSDNKQDSVASGDDKGLQKAAPLTASEKSFVAHLISEIEEINSQSAGSADADEIFYNKDGSVASHHYESNATDKREMAQKTTKKTVLPVEGPVSVDVFTVRKGGSRKSKTKETGNSGKGPRGDRSSEEEDASWRSKSRGNKEQRGDRQGDDGPRQKSKSRQNSRDDDADDEPRKPSRKSGKNNPRSEEADDRDNYRPKSKKNRPDPSSSSSESRDQRKYPRKNSERPENTNESVDETYESSYKKKSSKQTNSSPSQSISNSKSSSQSSSSSSIRGSGDPSESKGQEKSNSRDRDNNNDSNNPYNPPDMSNYFQGPFSPSNFPGINIPGYQPVSAPPNNFMQQMFGKGFPQSFASAGGSGASSYVPGFGSVSAYSSPQGASVFIPPFQG